MGKTVSDPYGFAHKEPNVMKDDVETMKKMRSVLITFMLLATLFLVTACAGSTNPYEGYDAEGYTVSVRFDANGGEFGTGLTSIVDAYDPSKLPKNSAGNYELGLLAPDNQIRGSGNYYEVSRPNYFLAGWYTERTESKDGNGNVVYSYAGKWDFSKDLYEVDASKTYTSSEPVVTLYAAWVPMFQINFVDRNSGEALGDTYAFNPLSTTEIKVPAWNKDGAMEMYKFPKKAGYTFEAAYYDQAGTQRIEGTVNHTGKVNEATGTAENHVMTVYVDMMEGEWFQISTVEQFQKNARPNGSYILHADLDFADTFWPTALMYGNFTGTIEGNGHKIMNVKLLQNDTGRTSIGLFGALTETAQLKDLTFENINLTIQNGTRMAGTFYGLLAGSASEKAALTNVSILSGKIQVDASKVYFGTDDYAIGKVFGSGYANQVDFTGIVCEAINNDEGKLVITEEGNSIELSFKD